MAGSYPDVPNHRVAYDRDGSIGWTSPDTGGPPVTVSASDLRAWNDHSNSQGSEAETTVSDRWYGIVFPETRDIDGFYFSIRGSGAVTPTLNAFQYSTNTTNGIDGTWTNVGSTVHEIDYDSQNERNNVTSVSLSGVKGLRWRLDTAAGVTRTTSAHFFGDYTSDLRFWHPTLDQEIDGAYMDWGDITQGSTDTRQVRVKNVGANTANSIVVSFEVLTDKSPTLVTQRDVSDDDVTYAASLDIGNLASGAISSVVYLRRTTPAGAQLGLGWGRWSAVAGSFT